MKILIETSVLLMMVFTLTTCTSDEPDFIDRMEIAHKNDRPIANASANYTPSIQISAEDVVYATVDGTDITGYLAQPDNTEGPLPGLIVIHEWWGLNDNIRMMTRRLADQGYKALAVDLYKGETGETPDQAGTLARQARENPDQAISNLEQAYTYLTEQQNVTKVGTIGWCFGGGWSLQAALDMPRDIDATVIYYGELVTDTNKLSLLGMPILGFFGAEDNGIPPDQVHAFEDALNEAGVANSIHIYEGAGHAFANPSGEQYRQEAADDAWQKTIAFFEENLK